MDFAKLRSNYYRDAAIMRAGEAAEVLFTRALAHCADQENGGIITREALPYLTPTKGPTRARALVREGLFEVIPEGWQITNWDKHQVSKEEIEEKRAAGRRRQATYRQRRKNGTRDAVSNGVTNGVTNGEVTPREVEEEVDNAAAAALRATPPLPPPLQILKGKLDAARLVVRWDRLAPEQVTQIEHLITTHGDQPLVKAALGCYRPDSPPAFAQAWLGVWASLPAPGSLSLVQQRCADHGVALSPAGVCPSCEADRKAAR